MAGCRSQPLKTGTLVGAGPRCRSREPGQRRAAGADRAKHLFLRADKSVSYGELMALMGLLRAAGYLKVALVGLEGVEAAAGRRPHRSWYGCRRKSPPARGHEPES